MISKILFQCDFNSFRSVQRRAAAEGDNNVGLKGFKTRRAGSQNINIWIGVTSPKMHTDASGIWLIK